VVAFGQFVTGNAFTQFDPAVVFIQGGLEGPVEFGQAYLLLIVITNQKCTVFGEFGLFFRALLYRKNVVYYNNIKAL